jgi:chemotaxis signal transduction protein
MSSNVVIATWSAKADELTHQTSRALLFLLGDITYAISVEYVERVIELPAVVAVPRTSDWLTGIAVYDSTPLPLIDPAHFLLTSAGTGGNREQAQSVAGRAIVVSCAHGRVLLAVDQLVTISDLANRQHVSTDRSEFTSEYIEFTCRTDESIVGVVSVPKLLMAAADNTGQLHSGTSH